MLAVEGTLVVPGELLQPYLRYQLQLLLLVFYLAEGVVVVFVMRGDLRLSCLYFSVEGPFAFSLVKSLFLAHSLHLHLFFVLGHHAEKGEFLLQAAVLAEDSDFALLSSDSWSAHGLVGGEGFVEAGLIFFLVVLGGVERGLLVQHDVVVWNGLVHGLGH